MAKNLGYYIEQYQNDNKKRVLTGTALTCDSKETNFYTAAITGNTTVNVVNFTANEMSEIVLELSNAGSHAITWSNGVKWIKPDGTIGTSIASTGAVLNNDGTKDFILLWSTDGGATVYGKVLR